MKVGLTRFGGVPDLPKDGSIPWPRPVSQEENRPFEFIAQVNLEQVPYINILHFYVADQTHNFTGRSFRSVRASSQNRDAVLILRHVRWLGEYSGEGVPVR